MVVQLGVQRDVEVVLAECGKGSGVLFFIGGNSFPVDISYSWSWCNEVANVCGTASYTIEYLMFECNLVEYVISDDYLTCL